MMEVKNLQSEVSCGEVDKIKTPFAHIIVGGTSEKPYYDIMWYGSDGYLHIGYGSSCLEYVFKWLSEEFEVIETPTIEVPRWIPVTERLPEKGGYYLVNARFGITIMEFTMGNERYMEKPSFVSELLGRCNGDVTHWMPLPKSPKDGDTMKLKPCPFCGGEAELIPHKFWSHKENKLVIDRYGVQCKKCETSGYQYWGCGEHAIRACNRRAT